MTFGQPAQQWSGSYSIIVSWYSTVPAAAQRSYLNILPYVHTPYLVTKEYCVPPSYVHLPILPVLRLDYSAATKTTVCQTDQTDQIDHGIDDLVPHLPSGEVVQDLCMLQIQPRTSVLDADCTGSLRPQHELRRSRTSSEAGLV